MIEISDQQFEQMVSKAIDAIPKLYYEKMQNVAFVVEDQPSAAQREKLQLLGYQSLYGLYEGIPLTKRGAGYNLVLPDKITIFKLPIAYSSNSLEEAAQQVRKTVWHEVAHYYGLDHDQIYKLEKKPPQA